MERNNNNNYRTINLPVKDVPQELLESIEHVLPGVEGFETLRLWSSDQYYGFQLHSAVRYFAPRDSDKFKPSSNNTRKDLAEIGAGLAKSIIKLTDDTLAEDEFENPEAADDGGQGRVRANRERSRTPKGMVPKVDSVRRKPNRRTN